MKPKAHQELDLAKDVKDKKKGISNNKSKAEDNMGPLLNRGGTLVPEEAEELLNVSFLSVFTDKTSLQESLTQEAGVKALEESLSLGQGGLGKRTPAQS